MQFVVKYPDAAVAQRAPYGALELALCDRSREEPAQRSTSTSYRGGGGSPLSGGTHREEIGGADRDRTDDPLLAKQVLSQLSYSPFKSDNGWWAWVDSNYRPHPYQGCALTN